jgi:ribosomal protein S18 acetylase RimI-like enzyme
MKDRSSFKILICTDAELVKSLHTEIFPMDAWYESKRSVMWVVWQGKEPVGFCMLSTTSEDYVFYSRAGVKRAYRGNGFQVRMLRVRERYARKHGFKKAITYTKIDNTNSNHNLQKAGYMLYAPQYKYADPDCLYWLKLL